MTLGSLSALQTLNSRALALEDLVGKLLSAQSIQSTQLTALQLRMSRDEHSLYLAVDGLVTRSSVDYDDVVERLEQLCEASSPIGVPECTSLPLLSLFLLTTLSCILSASFTYMFMQA